MEIPPLSGPVVDQAGILSGATAGRLASLLKGVHQKGTVQLQVLTLNSLAGVPIEQASIEITNRWQLGGKEKDNGILFLIVPSERKMRIEVGQGLEGDLPDVIAKRIIADVVAPYFRQELYDEGVLAGVVEILKYTDPAAVGAERAPPVPVERPGFPIWVILLFVVVIFLRLITGGAPMRRARGWGPGSYGGGWGGGGWGGSSGGGWSGGGGGFSGGGASGGW